jgi:hypothetical protein
MVDKSNAPNNNHKGEVVEQLKIRGSGFISENTGNIKDFYKISSCIGRGKTPLPILRYYDTPWLIAVCL